MIQNHIKSKADAMAFAIEKANNNLSIAQQIYQMFVDNMNLPDVDQNDICCCSKDLLISFGIVLPNMPYLEWMTENLSGFGGTKINNNTYYTYDKAEEAVKQLGKGWRLPTRGEMNDLINLGSTWDNSRKGRWFGGNNDTDHKGSLFLPALGCHCNTSRNLMNVSYGTYWSFASTAEDNYHAGFLGFCSDHTFLVNGAIHTYERSVRCVRDVNY